MSDLESDDERRLLRSIGWRRVVRGFAIMIPCFAAWWLSSWWIARRWDLQPELVRFGILFLFGIPGIFAPRWLDGPGHDPRETPRLRWLNRERADRHVARDRFVVVLALGLVLLMQCLLLPEAESATTAFPDTDGMVWIILFSALTLCWRPADLGDEGAQMRYLFAVNRGFVVTLMGCLGVLTLDAFRGPVMLRPILETVLLAGCLTLHLSLVFGEPRPAPDRG